MHHNPGKNVLFVAAPLATVARLTGLAEDAARLSLESARRMLLEARNSRPAPFVDRTRYANWNVMMASAMLRADTSRAASWEPASTRSLASDIIINRYLPLRFRQGFSARKLSQWSRDCVNRSKRRLSSTCR